MHILINKVTEYLETRLELIQLKTVDKSSDLISTVLSYLILFSIINIFVIILSIGISIWISSKLQNSYSGFLVVALGYLIIGIICYLSRKKMIKKSLQDILINDLLK